MNSKTLLVTGSVLLTAIYYFSDSNQKLINHKSSGNPRYQDSSSLASTSHQLENDSEEAALPNAKEPTEIEPGLKLDPSERRWIASELQSAVKAGIINENQTEEYRSVLLETIKRDREVMTEELTWGDDDNANE